MLREHFAAHEKLLRAVADVQASTGHSLHKGTPREAFVREFLCDHLAETVAIGTGEIIDADSQPGSPRNQHDVVIYRRAYPTLYLGGGVRAFLAESVVATIEVKSTLDEPAVKQAASAARNTKALRRTMERSIYEDGDRSIRTYVVAYKGPAQMSTAHTWLTRANEGLGLAAPEMPPNFDRRARVASPSLDGIFVLGRGFVYFDNLPSFGEGVASARDEPKENLPPTPWVVIDAEDCSLLALFSFLAAAITAEYATINPRPYLAGVKLERVRR